RALRRSSVIARASRLFAVLGLPPRPTPFPYTTLFRSGLAVVGQTGGAVGDTGGPCRERGDELGAVEGEGARGLGEGLVVVDEHRSEEHTSELQSRENLVCRLLLEKKKD